jgi:hypothetical protein
MPLPKLSSTGSLFQEILQVFFFFDQSSMCYQIYCRPEGLHEKKVQDPYNSKPEISNLKNSCLSRDTNFSEITFEPLYIKAHSQTKI